MLRGLNYEERIKLFIEAQKPNYTEEYLYFKNLLFNFEEYKIKKREIQDINLGDDFIENNFFDLIDDTIDLQNLENEYQIRIHGEMINFIRNNFLGSTSRYYLGYKNKEILYFMKIPNSFDLLLKEIYLLKKLDKYPYFPKLIQSSNKYLITNYCGEIVNRKNIPANAVQQGNEICDILKRENIIHTDIKIEEILVKDGKIYLVDFGYALLDGKQDCGLKINPGKSTNDYRDDRDILIYLLERVQNPLETYKKNILLKNLKNKKWYNWKK